MHAGGSSSDPYQLIPIIQSPGGTNLFDTGGYDLRGRGAPVAVDSVLSTAVILSWGQSYSANSATGGYVVTQAQNHNFSIHNGAIYVSLSNLLGCSDVGDGTECFIARLGDKIIAGGAKQRVIMVPISIGGTHISQWAVGGSLNHRLVVVAKRLAAAGLTVTHTMVSIGSGDAVLGTTKAAFKTGMQSALDTLTANGITATAYLEKDTWIGGSVPAGGAAIRTGIDEMVNGTTIKAGPDSDTLNNTNRHDTTHWNATGADAVSVLWKAALGL